jgi:branched-chain amino acid transport system ATP-binding protein
MIALLDVKDLHASYGSTRVLHGIDLSVEAGAITALLGANGAGKTSTLRALCQMTVSTTRGTITFDGKRANGCATEDIVRMGVAHVPDGRGTFGGLSTEENLRLGAYVRRDKATVAADFERVYGYFPRLKERRAQQAGTLSGGEQQMLAIGRALMSRPRLLLLDEPSFGLAPLIVKDLFDILQRINQDDKVAILLVEQNAALALEVADTAYLLETGRIVVAGTAQDFLNNDAVRRVYLGQ